LLNGKGSFPRDTSTPSPKVKETKSEPEEKKLVKPESTISPQLSKVNSDQIERIVIFYKNGVFKTYTPE
jgi:hypothetical protein